MKTSAAMVMAMVNLRREIKMGRLRKRIAPRPKSRLPRKRPGSGHTCTNTSMVSMGMRMPPDRCAASRHTTVVISCASPRTSDDGNP